MPSKQSVGFIDSVQDVFQHFSDFEGRTKRPVFWWYALFYVLVLAACGVFDFVELSNGVTLAYVFSSIFAIVTLIPTLAVGIRRLRDTGENWQHIFWLLLPFLGLVITAIYWSKPSARK